jgi:glycosyltransferase involved in cell wall biosynthesis
MNARPRILALFGARVIFGAERENIESLAALREQGCEVLCLVRDEAWNHAIPEALAARGLACASVPYIDGWLPGWRLHILFRNPIAFFVGNWQFLRIIRKFRPTHIHAFNPLYVLSFLPGLTLVRTPMVYRAGDIPIRHRRIWRLLWRFIIWRTQRFVAVSRFIAREVELTGVEAYRIEIIYGTPPTRLGQEEAPVPLPAVPAAPDVVFVGQIVKNKGPHLLIHAFRTLAGDLPQGRLLIVGRISQWKGDEWARNLRDFVTRDPVLGSRVVFVGFVENVPALLQGRTVLVAPTLTEEPLGLVVMEAKAAGLPSVVFPSGGLPEMIEHGVDGYICRDKSVEALTEALNLYLTDPSLTLRQGAAAKASLRRLGVEEFANRWLAVYERTM